MLRSNFFKFRILAVSFVFDYGTHGERMESGVRSRWLQPPTATLPETRAASRELGSQPPVAMDHYSTLAESHPSQKIQSWAVPHLGWSSQLAWSPSVAGPDGPGGVVRSSSPTVTCASSSVRAPVGRWLCLSQMPWSKRTPLTPALRATKFGGLACSHAKKIQSDLNKTLTHRAKKMQGNLRGVHLQVT